MVGRSGAPDRPFLTPLNAISTVRGTLVAMEVTMYQRILVPTDGSDITAKAVQSAISLARSLSAQLYTISVKEPFPYSAISEMQPTPPQEFFDAQERIAASRVKQVVDAARTAGLECTAHTVEALHPWEAIVDYAKQHGCDLIVMASHGRRGMAALLLGSETQKVLTHSSVPVLVVR
jgi:nucleotide-binding universal stress UspA family protein